MHDDWSRECLWIEIDTALSGARVARMRDFITTLRGHPTSLLTDKGAEFAGLDARTPTQASVHHAGASGENGDVENFNGQVRDECLNERECINLQHPASFIEASCDNHSEHQPYSSTGDLMTAELASFPVNPSQN